MRTAAKIMLSASLLALAACGPKRSKGPDWATSAPAGTVMAVSGQAGWVVQQRELQSILGRYPLAERTLDLFLKRARINPQGETGRISLYVMDLQLDASRPQGGIESSNFLLQLGAFRDPKNLLLAVTEAFPMEGTLQVGKHEFPLYVLLDFNQFHMRMILDEQDRIWIGDLSALATLGRHQPLDSPSLRAAEWINGQAPVQGLLLPENLLKQAAEKLPQEFAKELPKGIQALAWSVTPSPAKEAPHVFEMAITGTPEGIQQLSPWVQRLVAFISSMPGAPSHPADVFEEKTRVGLRAQLSSSQLEAVMARIAQPGLFKVSRGKDPKP